MAAEDIFTADSADITLGEPAEVVGGTDAAEPVPIEKIIAHNEEIAEQVGHGRAGAPPATPARAAGEPDAHGRADTTPTGPVRGDEAAARRDPEEQA